MKKMLLSIFCVLAFISATAQVSQVVYLFKNNKPVDDRDSADLIRIIKEPDSDSMLLKLYEFYQDGTRKTLGTLSAYIPELVHQGTLLSFYKNGMRKSTEEYVNNELTGKAMYYFENGKLQKSVEYGPGKTLKREMKLIYLTDSVGNVTVKDGNGHAVEKLSGSRLWVEEGNYVKGKKDGVWATKNAAGDSSYTETYRNGRFISGVSLLKGVIYSYKEIDEAAKCKRGMEAYYDNVHSYLANGKGAHADVYGKIFLRFTILADGSFSEPKVDRGLGPDIDKLALRAIDTGLKWLPGRHHGIPVAQTFHIPISLDRSEKWGWPDFTTPGSLPSGQ